MRARGNNYCSNCDCQRGCEPCCQCISTGFVCSGICRCCRLLNAQLNETSRENLRAEQMRRQQQQMGQGGSGSSSSGDTGVSYLGPIMVSIPLAKLYGPISPDADYDLNGHQGNGHAKSDKYCALCECKKNFEPCFECMNMDLQCLGTCTCCEAYRKNNPKANPRRSERLKHTTASTRKRGNVDEALKNLSLDQAEASCSGLDNIKVEDEEAEVVFESGSPQGATGHILATPRRSERLKHTTASTRKRGNVDEALKNLSLDQAEAACSGLDNIKVEDEEAKVVSESGSPQGATGYTLSLDQAEASCSGLDNIKVEDEEAKVVFESGSPQGATGYILSSSEDKAAEGSDSTVIVKDTAAKVDESVQADYSEKPSKGAEGPVVKEYKRCRLCDCIQFHVSCKECIFWDINCTFETDSLCSCCRDFEKLLLPFD